MHDTFTNCNTSLCIPGPAANVYELSIRKSRMLVFLQVLQKAGLPDAQLMHLSTQVFQLQCAYERMALVKEYRYCPSKLPLSLASACTCCLSGCILAVLCSRSVGSERWRGSFSLVRLAWQMSVQVTCLSEYHEDLSGACFSGWMTQVQ